jgi:hypothetical protein
MSHGLGALQREIKRVLTKAFELGMGPLRWTHIRGVFIVKAGGRDKLEPTRERSIKRALKSLVDSRDVLIIGGKGGPGDPHRYVTAECFAGSTGEVKDTAHAKKIVAELCDEAAKAMQRVPGPAGATRQQARRRKKERIKFRN